MSENETKEFKEAHIFQKNKKIQMLNFEDF